MRCEVLMLNLSVIEIREQKWPFANDTCMWRWISFSLHFPKIYSRCVATECLPVCLCSVRTTMCAINLHGSRAMKCAPRAGWIFVGFGVPISLLFAIFVLALANSNRRVCGFSGSNRTPWRHKGGRG